MDHRTAQTELRCTYRRRWGALAVVVGGALVALLSCRVGKQAPGQVVATAPTNAPATHPATPATAPTTARSTFDSPLGNFQVSYPSGWDAKTGGAASTGVYQGKKFTDTTVLTLVPTGAKDDERSISIDLPSLPPHIPGLIPIGMVATGYISDLRQQHADLKVEESAPSTAAQAQARRIHLTWNEKGHGCFDLVVLIVRNDRIYIFSADGDAKSFHQINSAFKLVVDSLHWTK